MELELPRLLAPGLPSNCCSHDGLCRVHYNLHPSETHEAIISCRCLLSGESGQFSRLLPSIEVVAISQAPSPESNPDSPLPVTAYAGHYPAYRLIGRCLDRSCIGRGRSLGQNDLFRLQLPAGRGPVFASNHGYPASTPTERTPPECLAKQDASYMY